MKHGKIEAAPKDGPDVLLGGEQRTYTPKAKKSQGVLVQRMLGLGPVQLLADKGCEPPCVVIERRPTKAFVFIEHAPRGMGARVQEFLNPDSPAVERYAFALGRFLQGEALKAKDRKDGLAQARWIARIAAATGGGE